MDIKLDYSQGLMRRSLSPGEHNAKQKPVKQAPDTVIRTVELMSEDRHSSDSGGVEPHMKLNIREYN